MIESFIFKNPWRFKNVDHVMPYNLDGNFITLWPEPWPMKTIDGTYHLRFTKKRGKFQHSPNNDIELPEDIKKSLLDFLDANSIERWATSHLSK